MYDSRQRRVSFFDRTGEYVRSFTLPTGDNLWRALDFFEDGALLVTARVRMPSSQQSGPRRGKNLYAVFNREGDSIATVGTFPDREMYV